MRVCEPFFAFSAPTQSLIFFTKKAITGEKSLVIAFLFINIR